MMTDLQLQGAMQEFRKLQSDAHPSEIADCAARVLLEAIRCCGIAERKIQFLRSEIDYMMHWEKMLGIPEKESAEGASRAVG